MLTELDRGGDYIELSLDGRPTWNPLSATWRDSYSLASPVASRLNQLFGNGKEPFGQPGLTPPRSAGSPTPGNVNVYNSKPRRAGRAEGYGRADDHRRTRHRDEGHAR